MKPNTLADNLNRLMAEARISGSELGRRIGLPAATIKKIRSGENSNPTIASLLPIAQYFSKTISQLVGDEATPNALFIPQHNGLSQLPVISWQEAVHWPEGKNTQHQTIYSEIPFGHNAYALIVEEENWEAFTVGSQLLIEPDMHPAHRNYIVTHKAGQSLPSLKQLLDDDGTLYLKPVVAGYQITPFTNEYRCLGVVVESKKRLC